MPSASSAPTRRCARSCITGDGDAFCAGMDLSASTVAQAGKPGFSTRSTSEALRAGVQTFIRELWELDKPTIAAVNGAAVGPGAHLALACDFVLVAARAPSSCGRSPSWGLVADAGGAYLLPRLVGLAARQGDGDARRERQRVPTRSTSASRIAASTPPRRCSPRPTHSRARLAAGPTRSLGLSKRLLNAIVRDGSRRIRSSSKGTSRRSRRRRPISSKGWPRSARSATRTSTASERSPRRAARRGVQRVPRRAVAAVAVPAHATSPNRPGCVDAPGRRHRLRRASRSRGAARARRGDRAARAASSSCSRRLGRRRRVQDDEGDDDRDTTASGSCTAPRSSAASCATRPTRARDRARMVRAGTRSPRSISSTRRLGSSSRSVASAVTMRIPIQYGTPGVVAQIVLAPPRSAYIEHRRRRHRRCAWAGPSGSSSARRRGRGRRSTRPVVSIGVHGWKGRWLVNGATEPDRGLLLREPVRGLRRRVPGPPAGGARERRRSARCSVDSSPPRKPNCRSLVNRSGDHRGSVRRQGGDRHRRRARHRPQSRVAARVRRRGGRRQRPRRKLRRRRLRRDTCAASGRRDHRRRAAAPSRTTTASRRGRAPSRWSSRPSTTFGGLDVLINNAGHPPRQDELQHGRGRVGRGHRRAPEGPLRAVPLRRRATGGRSRRRPATR